MDKLKSLMEFLTTILKDKTGQSSLREVVIAVCMLLIIASWLAQLVFKIPTPEYMFYSVTSLIAAGCFGYSIEKGPTNNDTTNH